MKFACGWGGERPQRNLCALISRSVKVDDEFKKRVGPRSDNVIQISFNFLVKTSRAVQCRRCVPLVAGAPDCVLYILLSFITFVCTPLALPASIRPPLCQRHQISGSTSQMRSIQGLQRPELLPGSLPTPAAVSCHACRVRRGGSSSGSSSGSSRHQRLVVVAANAPASGDTTPVSREDLVNHLRSGCKPRDKW